MRTHYRADVNYSDRQLDTASDRVFYIFQVCNIFNSLMLVYTELFVGKQGSYTAAFSFLFSAKLVLVYLVDYIISRNL